MYIYIYIYHTSDINDFMIGMQPQPEKRGMKNVASRCLFLAELYILIYIYICIFFVHVNLFGQNKIKHTPDHGEMCEVSQLCSQYAQYVKMDTVWGLPKSWKLQAFHCEPMFFWPKIQ